MPQWGLRQYEVVLDFYISAIFMSEFIPKVTKYLYTLREYSHMMSDIQKGQAAFDFTT